MGIMQLIELCDEFLIHGETENTPCFTRYSGNLQWADGSIAYSAWHDKPLNIQQCGRMKDVTEPIKIKSCVQKPHEKDLLHFLCETHTALDTEAVGPIQLAKDLTGNLSVSGIVCPDAHQTHTFLACDVKSACWANGHGVVDNRHLPSIEQCPTPLELFSPLFKCVSHSQLVPYTLVCDHRHDCHDYSDEDFCVFQPCSGQTVIPCSTSSQVRSVWAALHRFDFFFHLILCDKPSLFLTNMLSLC